MSLREWVSLGNQTGDQMLHLLLIFVLKKEFTSQTVYVSYVMIVYSGSLVADLHSTWPYCVTDHLTL